MSEDIYDRLNKLRMERSNLEITLVCMDASIERLELEISKLPEEEE